MGLNFKWTRYYAQPIIADHRFKIQRPSLRPWNIKWSETLALSPQPRTPRPPHSSAPLTASCSPAQRRALSPIPRTASSPQPFTAPLAATRSPAPSPLPTSPRCSGVDPAREAWIRLSVPQGMSAQSGGGSYSGGGGEREPGSRQRRRALDRSSSAGGTLFRGRCCTHPAKLELTGTCTRTPLPTSFTIPCLHCVYYGRFFSVY